MPLPVKRPPQVAREAALQERKRARRSLTSTTSLPQTIDSTTSVNLAKVERRKSIRRQSLQQQHHHHKAAPLAKDESSSTNNNDENHSPNVKQGPTPYWKVRGRNYISFLAFSKVHPSILFQHTRMIAHLCISLFHVW